MELKFRDGTTEDTTTDRSNRTFMELKSAFCHGTRSSRQFQSHLYGIEIRLLSHVVGLYKQFQSHLYGIEMKEGEQSTLLRIEFQSHLYGIEIWQARRAARCAMRSNYTFMELKGNL